MARSRPAAIKTSDLRARVLFGQAQTMIHDPVSGFFVFFFSQIRFREALCVARRKLLPPTGCDCYSCDSVAFFKQAFNKRQTLAVLV